jgi:glycosyltransferase involved in cell wall biosynthesis
MTDLVSVVIPARNAADTIGRTVRTVMEQRPPGTEVEVIVVDDGSTDDTASLAVAAGARVIPAAAESTRGNPAAARNRGVAGSRGDPVIFLDADCTPADGWLEALLTAHDNGAASVGGSLGLPPGLPATARFDYYCGWYHVHPRRPPGYVVNHPPCNLSVRRAAFAATSGFSEQHPIAYAHEELAWQAELQEAGHRVYFEPRAIVYHWNRPGLRNLLGRNYRWGYSSIEAKSMTGAARAAWLYKHPLLCIALSLPLAPLQAAYIVGCWLRAGEIAALSMFPVVLAARFAYATGAIVGGLRWLRRGSSALASTPRWT